MSNIQPLDGEYPNQLLGVEVVQSANAGAVNVVHAPFKLDTVAGAPGVILNSGTGVPGVGGNVGDVYVRKDFSGANTWIYQCTVAGAAGAATWVGKV